MLSTTCQASTLVEARDTGTRVLQCLPGKPEQKPEEYGCIRPELLYAHQSSESMWTKQKNPGVVSTRSPGQSVFTSPLTEDMLPLLQLQPLTSPMPLTSRHKLTAVICCKACKNNLNRRARNKDVSQGNWGRCYKRAEDTCSAQAAKSSGSPGQQQHQSACTNSKPEHLAYPAVGASWTDWMLFPPF